MQYACDITKKETVFTVSLYIFIYNYAKRVNKMKKRQLKIRGILLISLVIILGSLLILYFAFCRGGDYNTAPIETTTQEKVTEAPTEVVDEETTVPEETTTEETTTEPVIWDNYDPTSVLAGENWALTLINKKYPLNKNYTI